jgi:hypothetical protein
VLAKPSGEHGKRMRRKITLGAVGNPLKCRSNR